MTLGMDYKPLGHSRARWSVSEGIADLGPVRLIVADGASSFADYLSADDARRLAWALIDQANKADMNRGKAGIDPTLLAAARAQAPESPDRA